MEKVLKDDKLYSLIEFRDKIYEDLDLSKSDLTTLLCAMLIPSIDDKVVMAILEYNRFYHSMSLFENPDNEYGKIKKQDLKDTLKYIRTLEKRQKEMSKIGCYI